MTKERRDELLDAIKQIEPGFSSGAINERVAVAVLFRICIEILESVTPDPEVPDYIKKMTEPFYEGHQIE